MIRKWRTRAIATTVSVVSLVPLMPATAATTEDAARAAIDRGRYMVLTGHCNNCHTASFAAKQGQVPEEEWLLGNPVGFRSAAGTTYGSNLRISIQNFTEDQWVTYAKRTKPRPPMPWWSLQSTTEPDLRAMYRYIRHLGSAGKPAPDFVPGDKEPPPPYETRQLVR
jgi:mono/diheme cytochrome c family protein